MALFGSQKKSFPGMFMTGLLLKSLHYSSLEEVKPFLCEVALLELATPSLATIIYMVTKYSGLKSKN